MKKLFDPHRHKLSEGEREYIWRRISEPGDLRARRRTQLWRRLGYSGAVVLAALLVGILWRPAANVDKMHKVPVPSELTPRAGAPTAMAPEDVATAMKSAAPVEPAPINTVAPSAPARRSAADETVDKAAQSPALAEIRVEPAPPEEMKNWAKNSDVENRETEQSYGIVTGIVIDSETGDPLPYANVVASGTQFGAMSLEDGSFRFLLPVGIYDIKCLYMGYGEMLVEGIRIWEGYSDSLQFAMNPSLSLTVGTILVEGEASTIHVMDSSERRNDSTKKLENFHVENIYDAMALQAGVRVQGGMPHVRGGRSDEMPSTIMGMELEDSYRDPDARPEHPRRRPRCWVPPYYHNPNGEAFDAMYFENYGTNPFVVTDEDALSTFALDVDNASYTLTRAYLERGELPPRDAVRVEEFVNFFDQGYEDCHDEDFCLRVDGAPSPFGEGYHLLRVGVQARTITADERLPANLVFVVDTSGSMDRENRLGLVKRALLILLDELEDSDTVGIVEYGSQARLVLEPTAVEDRRRIERALRNLAAGGSTNAEAGLWLGYEMAARLDTDDTNTRLILCSDGVANMGETQAEKILDRVRLESDRGIALSAIGFGMGNYNDVLMEKLADKGDGNYYYVDELDEAARVFRENLTGTLQTVARDAKVQVEFDSESVLRWRLIGYENRDIADEDFRDDSVDAGELGSGHQATALYELKLSDEALRALERLNSGKAFPLSEVFLRYEHPVDSDQAGLVEEISVPIDLRDIGTSFNRAAPQLRRSALAAEFAEILRGSYWAKDSEFEDLLPLAKSLLNEFRYDDSVDELHKLIQRAARLEGGDRD